MVLILLSLACSAPDPPDDVVDAMGGCLPGPIEQSAAREGLSLAFEACGSNRFRDFAWSRDGRLLYFALPADAYVMDASAPDRRTTEVPGLTPSGAAVWLDAARLVVPARPEVTGGPERIGVYDTKQRSLSFDPTPGADVLSVHRGATSSEIVFHTSGATAGVWRLDLSTGATAPAFPWLDGSIDTLSYTPEANAVVIGRGETVTLHDAGTGTARGSWSPAHAGALHGDGRWLVLEHAGEPLARYKPPARPPLLSIVDLASGRGWLVSTFHGKGFEWYPFGRYGSFVLWGFDQIATQPNVALVDLTPRLDALAAGGEVRGLVPWSAVDPALVRPPSAL